MGFQKLKCWRIVLLATLVLISMKHIQSFVAPIRSANVLVSSNKLKIRDASQMANCPHTLRMDLRSEDPEFARKLRLREETEYPFRKIRMFAFASSIASASVGFFISSTRLLAKATGVQGVQDTTELVTNIGIDLGVVVVCAFLLKNEYESQAKILERMAQGARIASLRVRAQLGEGQGSFTLSDFRRDRGRDKRLAIFVGSSEIIQQSLNSSIPLSERLMKNDLLAIPVAIAIDENNKMRCTGEESGLDEAIGQEHVALPISITQWQQWVESEVELAQSQGVDVIKSGLTFIIKKNGRVGQRAVGCPPWEVFIGDVENRASAGMDVTNI